MNNYVRSSENARSYLIVTGGYRTPDEIAKGFRDGWQRIAYVNVRSMFYMDAFRSPALGVPRRLWLTMIVDRGFSSMTYVFDEFASLGLRMGYLDDALRLMEAYPDAYWVNIANANYNIVFINPPDPSRSLELGFDGMGQPFLRIVHALRPGLSVCYAARQY